MAFVILMTDCTAECRTRGARIAVLSARGPADSLAKAVVFATRAEAAKVLADLWHGRREYPTWHPTIARADGPGL